MHCSSTGFSNWKDGLVKIRSHVRSKHHKEANEALLFYPNRLRTLVSSLILAIPAENLEIEGYF